MQGAKQFQLTGPTHTFFSAQSCATADAGLRVVKGLKGASRIEHRKPRDPLQRVPGTSRALVGDGEGSVGENLVRWERYTASSRRAGTGYTDHAAVRAWCQVLRLRQRGVEGPPARQPELTAPCPHRRCDVGSAWQQWQRMGSQYRVPANRLWARSRCAA